MGGRGEEGGSSGDLETGEPRGRGQESVETAGVDERVDCRGSGGGELDGGGFGGFAAWSGGRLCGGDGEGGREVSD